MSSVDLSDPNITSAYQALRDDSLRWFLLTSDSKPNILSLCASGTGDLDELRSYLQPEKVYYGVFREQAQDKSLRVSLNYIPNSVKGVRRARALVHGKSVTSKFKTHHILNASSPDEVTIQALHTILGLPSRTTHSTFETASSGAGGHQPSASTPGSLFSGIQTTAPSSTSQQLGLPIANEDTPSSRFGSSILGISLANDPTVATTRSTTVPFDEGEPTPTYPSTSRTHASSSLNPIRNGESATDQDPAMFPLMTSPTSFDLDGLQGQQNTNPLTYATLLAKQNSRLPPPPPDSDVLSQDSEQNSVYSDREVGIIPDSQSVVSFHSSNHTPSPASLSPLISHSPLEGSITQSPEPNLGSGHVSKQIFSLPLDTSKENQLFKSIVNLKEESANKPVTQKMYPRLHERGMTAANAEEERKLAVLEEERRRRAAERVRREKEEKAAEEAREREFEERKEREKQRRIESARKAEERRAEQKRQQEEAELNKKIEKDKKELEIQRKRKQITRRFQKQAGMNLLSGFITLESSGNWKRRYYRLSTEDWVFFKNDEETTTSIHAIELSQVQALREWQEGYEELEAIPHSFAVELKDDVPQLFFADSAEDKEIIMGLLNQGAGL